MVRPERPEVLRLSTPADRLKVGVAAMTIQPTRAQTQAAVAAAAAILTAASAAVPGRMAKSLGTHRGAGRRG